MSWDVLLEQLRLAGEVVTGPTGGQDDRELAEGYRHLTRIFAIAAEMLVEKGDPAHPAFTRWMTAHRKMYGDNPKTVYDAAIVNADHHYVIRGVRGDHAYLGFCLYGTAVGGAKRMAGNLNDDEMSFKPDGSFEVHLGGPARTTNWLDLESDVTEVMIRQYFSGEQSGSTYSIETIPAGGPPPALSLAVLEPRLAALGRYVRETIEAETTLSALSASISPDTFRSGSTYVNGGDLPTDPPIDASVIARVMPTPAIQYSGQWYDDLRDDEILVVTGRVPDCRYLSIQLLSRFMESGDWAHYRCYLTDRDLELEPDGSFVVHIAHANTGHPNWLDTSGLRSATVAVRALRTEETLDVTFTRTVRAL